MATEVIFILSGDPHADDAFEKFFSPKAHPS